MNPLLHSRSRNVVVYAFLLLAVLTLGYGSRHFGKEYLTFLPPLVAKRVGDGLWASAVMTILCLLFRRKSTLRLATTATVIAFAIEFSQRYHAPWIDHIRSYTLGAIILGYSFYWWDLAAYVVGISLIVIIDLSLRSSER